MRDSYIPQYLDVPERFIVFTPDEMIIVIAPLGIVTVFVNFLVALLAATACFYALRKFKQGGPLTRVLWRAYWLLPSDYLGLKATPPSYLRQLAG